MVFKAAGRVVLFFIIVAVALPLSWIAAWHSTRHTSARGHKCDGLWLHKRGQTTGT